MKNIFQKTFYAFTVFSMAILIFGLFVFGTARIRPMLSISQTENVLYNSFGGQTADTLRSVSSTNDTLIYPFTVNHINHIDPYFVFFYDKISSNPTSIKINFYQSLDGINWFSLKRPVNRVYTKSETPTADTYYEYSFKNDTVQFEGRFVRAEVIMINTSSTYSKAAISGKVKFNVK